MYYSLREKNIKKKNLRKTFLYILLSFVITATAITLGIKSLVFVINFISDLKQSDSVAANKDTIPPKVPYLHAVDEYTKNKNIEIKGEAEAGSFVILKHNGKEYETVAENSGGFIFSVELLDGINSFQLHSKDVAGNSSLSGNIFRIVYDTTTPPIEILKPSDGSTFSGKNNMIVELQGKTEPDVKISINDRLITVSDDGMFNHRFSLQSGENKITIKGLDLAENEEVKNLTLYYYE